VGLNGWRESGTIQNSLALNPSVLAAGANVGRVAGINDGPLSDNHAREDMVLKHNSGTPYVPTPATASHDKKDGISTPTAELNTEAFWRNTMKWDFSPTGAWEWRDGFLPLLRGVGGEQRPLLP